jgi:hypothetical protein
MECVSHVARVPDGACTLDEEHVLQKLWAIDEVCVRRGVYIGLCVERMICAH